MSALVECGILHPGGVLAKVVAETGVNTDEIRLRNIGVDERQPTLGSQEQDEQASRCDDLGAQ
jgi:hypothetical protein